MGLVYRRWDTVMPSVVGTVDEEEKERVDSLGSLGRALLMVYPEGSLRRHKSDMVSS